METIDQVVIRFNPEQLNLLNICLAFLMFGVALDLRVDHFKELIRQPRRPLLGLVSQWILLPALTIGLIALFRPAPSMALGMILIACCPGGNVSNYAVHLSGSNTALSIVMTTISTLAAVIVTPIYFAEAGTWLPETRALASQIHVPLRDMIFTILKLIVLPLLLGMVINARFPAFTARIEGAVKGLSMAVFLSFIAFALYGNWNNLVNYIHLVFLLVFVHNSLALIIGYQFGRLMKLSLADTRTISIETGIQNSGLALLLIFNFFDGLGGMAIMAAWWGIWHLVSAFSLAMFWRHRIPQPRVQPAS
jgi:bile acid:Na+ symporter, BASS family